MTEEARRNEARERAASVKSRKHDADSPATSRAYRDAMSSTPSPGTHVVVVGAGMVAHRFVESLLTRADEDWRITLLGDEGRAPYDRVGLTGFFSGASADDLTLERSVLDDPRVRFVSGDPVARIDRRRSATRPRLLARAGSDEAICRWKLSSSS